MSFKYINRIRYSVFLHKELPSYNVNIYGMSYKTINYKNKYYNYFEKYRLDSFLN